MSHAAGGCVVEVTSGTAGAAEATSGAEAGATNGAAGAAEATSGAEAEATNGAAGAAEATSGAEAEATSGAAGAAEATSGTGAGARGAAGAANATCTCTAGQAALESRLLPPLSIFCSMQTRSDIAVGGEVSPCVPAHALQICGGLCSTPFRRAESRLTRTWYCRPRMGQGSMLP